MPRAVKLETITPPQIITYILDSNVLIHDPNALLNFDEHRVTIPMTVLEKLDHLKNSKQTIAADCRQAIRLMTRSSAMQTLKRLVAVFPLCEVIRVFLKAHSPS